MTSERPSQGDHSQGDLRWALTLYVNGSSPRSAVAVDTVRRVCDEDLHDRADLVVIDVSAQGGAGAAVPEPLRALPTLVRRRPLPVRELVGDLGDADRIRHRLGLAPPPPGPPPPPQEPQP